MHASNVLLFLAASGASAHAIAARDIQVGWALAASSAPSGTTECSDAGFYCPSSLTCVKAASHEAPACCSSSSECRGDIEGSPKCADSSWSLFTGNSGNGFCCGSGEVGLVDYAGTVVGTCTASAAAGATTASEQSTAATVAASTTSSAAASTSAASSSSASESSAASSSSASESSASSSASGSASSASSSASKSASKSASSASASASSAAASASGTASSSAAASSATGNSAGNVVAGMVGITFSGLMMVAAL